MTVSTDDVAALLGRDLTSDEEDRAGRLIDIAEGLVEAALPGFSFAAGTETVDIAWNDPDVIWTPRYPVTAINTVTVGDAPVSVASEIRWTNKGRIELAGGRGGWVVNGSWWDGAWPVVTVGYDYGLDPVPAVLAGMVAAMVGGILTRQSANPSNVRSETVGSYSVTYAGADNAPPMSVPPLPALWRRTGMVSVPLVRYR